MTLPLRLGTRGSRLALWQANHVAALLQPLAGARSVVLVEIQTDGDQIREAPLAQIGGDGIFTKQIQRALLEDRVDVAVHSLKDLPTTYVDGVMLAAVPARGPSGDVLVSTRHSGFAQLPLGARVATGSTRRQAQLRHRRPDLKIVPIRGNVETRLCRLAEQDLDAIILAQAGLMRLGLADVITEILDPAWMLPAVGQGALGLECRAGDGTTLDLLAGLNHLPTRQAVLAERALLRGLGGGCQVPIGAATTVTGDRLTLRGVVLDPEGKTRIEGRREGFATGAEEVGRELAGQLLEQGADELLGLP
jgi:hydroxymethylbilane synthase